MGDDIAVQKLIEILTAFYTEARPFEEDLNFSITSEFLENLKAVLFTKQLVSKIRWELSFKICYSQMHSNPEMYLKYVIYACRQCSRIYFNIFERFLNVFAIILHLRVVTFGEPAVNFSKLIPDTFMGLYEIELKKPFRRCGGFPRFVEYINNPKYLASNLMGKYASSYSNQKASADATSEDLDRQVMRIFREEKQLPKDFRLEGARIDRPSINLAQKILKCAKIEVSSSLSDDGLVAKLRDLPQKLKEKLAEEKKALEAKGMGLKLPSFPSHIMKAKLPVLPQQMLGQLGEEKKVLQVIDRHLELPLFPSDVDMKAKFPVLPQQMIGVLVEEKKVQEVKERALKVELDPFLNPDSETLVVVGQMEDNGQQKNIIQAVIRHNRSISPGQANRNNDLQKEACEILEHLKGKIETLIELLDEYDKE